VQDPDHQRHHREHQVAEREAARLLQQLVAFVQLVRGENRWWDTTNATLPNFTQAFTWAKALAERVGKPIVAAINGPVAGIGLCLALFCDLRLMADGAKLTTAFARRGLIAEHGSSWMLPRLVGPMAALDLLMSARTVSAGEAAQMGLVRLLPEPDFAASAHAVALELAQWSSPRSMAVIKRQVYDALTQSCTQAIEVADREMVASFASEDFREGVAHFVERRAPAFTGR